MATAFKSTQARSSRRERRNVLGQRSHLQSVASGSYSSRDLRATRSPLGVVPHASAPVQRILPRRPLPAWLRLLIRLQRGSLIVTFILVSAALVVYGSTIYMQQHWSKEYNKLKSMQRSERQIAAVGASLKNQLIQQAEQPGSGLVPRTPEHSIILERAPERLPVTANPVLTSPTDAASSSEPLSY